MADAVNNATLVRIHVGGRWGTGHPHHPSVIPHFETRVTELAQSLIAGATCYEGVGIWRGVQEPCMIVEVLISDDETAVTAVEVSMLVSTLREELAQDAVMVTRTRLEVEFAWTPGAMGGS